VVPRSRLPAVDPRLLVLAAAVLWGTTGTARALGPDGASPSAVGAARLVVGGTLLAALGWHRHRSGGAGPAGRGRGGTVAPTSRVEPGPRPRDGSGPAGRRRAVADGRAGVPLAVAAGAIAAYQPLFFGGVARTGVAVGTMVGIGSSPAFAGLLGLTVRGERPGRRWLAATGLAVAGTSLLVGAGDRDDVDPVGIALALGAGASYAVYVAATKVLLDRGRRPDVVTGQTFGLAAVALVPVAVVAGVAPLVSWDGAVMVAHLGLVTVVLAYLLFGRGLAGVGIAMTGTLTLAEPATATVLGVVALGEHPQPATAAGLALVAAGLVTLARARQPPRPTPGDGLAPAEPVHRPPGSPAP
jgi:DME family drug/metabolite transporter